jgi:hypothetical protein
LPVNHPLGGFGILAVGHQGHEQTEQAEAHAIAKRKQTVPMMITSLLLSQSPRWYTKALSESYTLTPTSTRMRRATFTEEKAGSFWSAQRRSRPGVSHRETDCATFEHACLA